jgi:FKBP-type peptidyl-prolyl cis-trans isomerase FklB
MERNISESRLCYTIFFNEKEMGMIRFVIVIAMALAGTASAQEARELKSQKEKLSYALGMDLANQLKGQSVEIDPDIFAQAVKDVMSGSKLLLTDDQARAAIAELQKVMMQKQQAQNAQVAEKNKADGLAFLAKNKTAEGVVTLPSGLQYKILKPGEGKKPTLTDTVTCNYRGTLINGTEFDSSYKQNQPVSFPVNGVIKGWTEALQLMTVGSKWQLFLPPDLAYGERGAGNAIPPNSALIFEVELISIQGK